MRRISDEDGLSAGWRNWGRLMLALIPAAMGGAACMWLAAASGWIDLSREMRIAERTMAAVGIAERPTEPAALVIIDAGCLKVDLSFMQGEEVVFYARNTCSWSLKYPGYSLRVKAGDGTVISSHDWSFDGSKTIGAGERREQRVKACGYYEGCDDRLERIELAVRD